MKYKEIIEEMTLEEKAAFLGGKNVWETREIKRLGIPSIFCSDGPHGIRKQAGKGDHLGLNASLEATCFPTAATIANSWDENLGIEIGKALGKEASVQQVHVLLGPGLNLKRSPLCGRNFEYFSEDPYLSGKMAAAYVRGIQSEGVYACPKHFAVNSQELRRMAMNAVIDERTLRELYLTGFEIAVKEGNARAVMTSYNEVKGVYANENRHLLKEILRDEWGFDGIVITDWGGSNDHAKGVSAGSNLEMPAAGLDSARELLKALEDGTLTMEEVDESVDQLLDAVIKLTADRRAKSKDFQLSEHHALAKKAAVESAVLLKNEDKILPLPAKCKVALIGDFAVEPRYQGAGSSVVNPTFLETMEKKIKDYDLQVVGISRGYRRIGGEDISLKDEAIALAREAQVVLFCFGLDEMSETEGLDRDHMRIRQNQIEVLEAISQVNHNIVGIISAGAPIEMPWQQCLKAILHGYLSGQAGASALLDILTGQACPSGKLSETYPLCYEDTPTYHYFPSKERDSQYREALYVGYRYYDTAKINVRYPFGYGLSYTEFAYTDLQITKKGIEFTLANIGDRRGAEVVQLYVGMKESKVFRPLKELKGFQKVYLEPGESRRVQIAFDDKTFRYWNNVTEHWEIEAGNYQIMVGASVADIRLSGALHVPGTTEHLPYQEAELPSYRTGQIRQVEDEEFTQILGYPVPQGGWSGELGINDSICQMYYAKSRLARFVWKILTKIKQKSEKKGKNNLNILFIYNMSFRALAKMTGGAVSMDMVKGMLTIVNGHFFRGVKQIIKGFLVNVKEDKEYEKMLSEEKTS